MAMMTTRVRAGQPLATRPALITRPLLIRFVSIVGTSASFYLMLSVVPMFLRAAGAGTGTAGLATTVLSLSTVAGYLPAPRLAARYGHRTMIAAGLVLLGMPAFALLFSANLTVTMAVCAVRGVGFAILCVCGGALTVSLIPAERRGEGLALIGVVSGIPSVGALPLGVWLAARVGYGPVFAAAGTVALMSLASLPGLPRGSGAPRGARSSRHGAGRRDGAGRRGDAAYGIVAGLRMPALTRLAVIFFAVTMTVGIFVTFVPLADSRGAAAPALLIQPAAAIAGRWLAGRRGDRRSRAAIAGSAPGTRPAGARPAALLAPGVLVAAGGFALLALTSVNVAIITGAALFGLGFGATQNVSLTVMYDQVDQEGFGAVSALWNLAYDAGMGVGAAGFGAVAAGAGFPAAFLFTAALPPAALACVAAAGRGARHHRSRGLGAG